jgi:Ca-activated chloride channel family protein
MPPALDCNGRVVFNTESCTVFVVDAQTGRQLWSRWLGDPLMSQPAVADGVVYMAYPGQGGHKLIAMSLQNGATRWEAPIAGDVISAPVIAKDAVFLSTNDGTVYKILREDGRVAWTKPMHATSAPFVDAGGSVHLSKGEAHGTARREGMQTLEALAGRAAGKAMAPRAAQHLEATVQRVSKYAEQNSQADAFVGFGSGAPAAAKTADAEANLGQSSVKGLWEFQGSRPVVVDGKSFATRGDVLQALDASGKVLWEEKMAGDLRKSGGQLASPPAYAGGKLVVGTLAGTIEAYDAGSGVRAFTIPIGAD